MQLLQMIVNIILEFHGSKYSAIEHGIGSKFGNQKFVELPKFLRRKKIWPLEDFCVNFFINSFHTLSFNALYFLLGSRFFKADQHLWWFEDVLKASSMGCFTTKIYRDWSWEWKSQFLTRINHDSKLSCLGVVNTSSYGKGKICFTFYEVSNVEIWQEIDRIELKWKEVLQM